MPLGTAEGHLDTGLLTLGGVSLPEVSIQDGGQTCSRKQGVLELGRWHSLQRRLECEVSQQSPPSQPDFPQWNRCLQVVGRRCMLREPILNLGVGEGWRAVVWLDLDWGQGGGL